MTKIFHGGVGDACLIEAAIRWGDWIKQQDGVSQKQRDDVDRVQDALKQYPNVVEGLVADYGFDLTDNRLLEWVYSEESGKHWDNKDGHLPPETVSYVYCVSYAASVDPNSRINIEIFKLVLASPSADSIGWHEYERLCDRIIPEGDCELSVYLTTEKYKHEIDTEIESYLIDMKTEMAQELDTRARITPQGFSIEWDISCNLCNPPHF